MTATVHYERKPVNVIIKGNEIEALAGMCYLVRWWYDQHGSESFYLPFNSQDEAKTVYEMAVVMQELLNGSADRDVRSYEKRAR